MRAQEIMRWHNQAVLNDIVSAAPPWTKAASRGLDWLGAQQDEESLLAAYEQLSRYARGALELVLRHFGPLPLGEDQLLRAAAIEGRWAGAEVLLGLAELRRLAILLAARKTWGDEMLFLPSDVFGSWQHIVLPLRLQPLSREQSRLVTARRGADSQPLSLQLLKGLRALVSSGLELTSRGLLPLKSIRRLMARLSMQEEELQSWGAAFAYRDDYPRAAAFVLDVALSLGLLKPEGNGYCWNSEAGEAWLALGGAAREHQLARHVASRYMLGEPALARCGAALLRLEPGGWYALADVRAWLSAPAISGGDAPVAVLSASAEAALDSCCALYGACGWLERAELPGTGPVFRMRLPRERQVDGQLPQQALYVQPDCEVIAPIDLPYTLRWQLEELAAVKTDAAVTVYKLTQASITQAVRCGWDEAALLQWLHAASQGAVPGNVAALVGDWARRARQVRLEQQVLLRCADRQTARQLASERRLEGLLGEPLGEQTFAVALERLPELRDMLEQLGFPAGPLLSAPLPAAGAKTQGGGRSGRGAGTEAAAELFYDPHSLKHCSPVEPEPLAPPLPLAQALGKLPKPWTSELRRYHASTQKELLEQALHWQTTVELRTESSLVTLIPSHMHDGEGADSWRIEGWLRQEGASVPERVTLCPGMWEEMRLVPPQQ